MLLRNSLIICLLLSTGLWSTADDNARFYGTTLIVNGHPLTNDTFALQSRGMLALIEGNTRTRPHRPMEFRVRLRRAGISVRQWPASQTEGIYLLPLNELWPFAQVGDELVVETIAKPEQHPAAIREKRVIKLTPINWLVNWLSQDHC